MQALDISLLFIYMCASINLFRIEYQPALRPSSQPHCTILDFFPVSCEYPRRWFVLEFIDSAITPDCFLLNMWNITYLVPAVTVQCPKTMSNLSSFRWRNIKWQHFDNFQPVIRLVYLSLHIWNSTRVSATGMVECPTTTTSFQIHGVQFYPERPILQAFWKKSMP